MAEKPSAKVINKVGTTGVTLSPDGTTLLVISVPTGLPELNYTGKGYGSLDELEADGIDHDFDVTNNVLFWEHAKDFFRQTTENTLFLLPVDESKTLTEILTIGTADYAKISLLLDQQAGGIKLLGVCLNPDSTAQTAGAGESADISTAIPKLQSLAELQAESGRYFSGVLEVRNLTDTPSAMTDFLGLGTNDRVSIFAQRNQTEYEAIKDEIPISAGYAAVGFLLGFVAKIEIQEAIGKVRNGDIGWINPQLSDGRLLSSFSENSIKTIHRKGLITTVKHTGKGGWFLGVDTTLAKDTDYDRISRRRVMDKALFITLVMITDELEDDKFLNEETGDLTTIEKEAIQNRIQKELESELSQAVSGITVGLLDTIIDGTSLKIPVRVNVLSKGIISEMTGYVSYVSSLN